MGDFWGVWNCQAPGNGQAVGARPTSLANRCVERLNPNDLNESIALLRCRIEEGLSAAANVTDHPTALAAESSVNNIIQAMNEVNGFIRSQALTRIIRRMETLLRQITYAEGQIHALDNAIRLVEENDRGDLLQRRADYLVNITRWTRQVIDIAQASLETIESNEQSINTTPDNNIRLSTLLALRNLLEGRGI